MCKIIKIPYKKSPPKQFLSETFFAKLFVLEILDVFILLMINVVEKLVLLYVTFFLKRKLQNIL